MSYTLIIAEKPNAAQRIADALSDDGKVEKVNNKGASYFKIECGTHPIIVAPAVGHLFVLDEKKDSKNGWNYPVFDVEWRPTYKDKGNTWSKKYFDNLSKLSGDADELISACDYDVEGSTIAFNIIKFIFKKEDGRRMKFSTLTKGDIYEAYQNASEHLDFPVIKAGIARHFVDWFFGINLSRALTKSLQKGGSFKVLSTGRVQGPTLKILDERENEIASFVSKPFWQLELKGILKGADIAALHIAGQIWEKDTAEQIFSKCEGKEAIVSDIIKKKMNLNPPFPFDLTTLQRDAYGLFGYSPKQTLDIAQTLYEQAAISYPRTSSQKLPAKLGHKNILNRLLSQNEFSDSVRKILSMEKIFPKEGSKTDAAHPAIYPTGGVPTKLNPQQKNIYNLVVRRYLATFGDPAVRESIKVTIDVNGEKFETTGTTTLVPNWIELYGKFAKFKETVLPVITKGDKVDKHKIEILSKKTQPPNRYNQASILKKMEDLGLGTKATRAQILQTLYDREYIKDPSISVTTLGKVVVETLDKYSPEIVSIDLTKNLDSEMEKIQEEDSSEKPVIEHARKDLERILAKFKESEAKIGGDLASGMKEMEAENRFIGTCDKCGNGKLNVIYSGKTGKRFVSCDKYPECTNTFGLPQKGNLTVLDEPCKKCGLKVVSIKTKGKRPWKLCIKCGFVNGISSKDSKSTDKKKTGGKRASGKAKE
ncbi:MAG: DNA topoisomerase I [Candidatus Aenigmarchaeota archaeon]|nr:DNA topoisomerase I [Candidatus Aenigmarchaeota archaeon]